MAVSTSGKRFVPFWIYVGICVLVLAMHSLDTVLNIQRRPDDELPAVIEEVFRNHPAEVSTSWVTHEVTRLRRFSGWFTLHTGPVVLWLALSVTQMLPGFRRRNIERHKTLGLVMLITSAAMLLGVFALLVRGEEIYGTHFSLKQNPFTFSAWTVVGGAWWIYCAIQGYRFAPDGSSHPSSSSKLQLHRRYMYHFLANGYSTGTARLLIFAYMLIKFPKNGKASIETEELDWLVDVMAWASFVVNYAGAEILIWAKNYGGKAEKTA